MSTDTEQTTAEKRAAALAKAREKKAEMANERRAEAGNDGHIEFEAKPHVAEPKPVDPNKLSADDKPAGLVEIEVLRPYAPQFVENEMGEMVPQGEITVKVPKGSVIKVPKGEASRALRLGIATATANTFGE